MYSNITLSLFLLYLMLIFFLFLFLHNFFFIIFKLFLNLEINKLKKRCKNIEYLFGIINRKKFKIYKSSFTLKNFRFKDKYIILEGNAYFKNNKVLIYNNKTSLIKGMSYYYLYNIELNEANSFIKYKRFLLFFWITKKMKINYKHSLTNIFKISDECIICYENKAINIPISECGHVGFCSDCYRKLNECPYCRCKYFDSSESPYSSFDDY